MNSFSHSNPPNPTHNSASQIPNSSTYNLYSSPPHGYPPPHNLENLSPDLQGQPIVPVIFLSAPEMAPPPPPPPPLSYLFPHPRSQSSTARVPPHPRRGIHGATRTGSANIPIPPPPPSLGPQLASGSTYHSISQAGLSTLQQEAISLVYNSVFNVTSLNAARFRDHTGSTGHSLSQNGYRRNGTNVPSSHHATQVPNPSIEWQSATDLKLETILAELKEVRSLNASLQDKINLLLSVKKCPESHDVGNQDVARKTNEAKVEMPARPREENSTVAEETYSKTSLNSNSGPITERTLGTGSTLVATPSAVPVEIHDYFEFSPVKVDEDQDQRLRDGPRLMHSYPPLQPQRNSMSLPVTRGASTPTRHGNLPLLNPNTPEFKPRAQNKSVISNQLPAVQPENQKIVSSNGAEPKRPNTLRTTAVILSKSLDILPSIQREPLQGPSENPPTTQSVPLNEVFITSPTLDTDRRSRSSVRRDPSQQGGDRFAMSPDDSQDIGRQKGKMVVSNTQSSMLERHSTLKEGYESDTLAKESPTSPTINRTSSYRILPHSSYVQHSQLEKQTQYNISPLVRSSGGSAKSKGHQRRRPLTSSEGDLSRASRESQTNLAAQQQEIGSSFREITYRGRGTPTDLEGDIPHIAEITGRTQNLRSRQRDRGFFPDKSGQWQRGGKRGGRRS